MTPSCVLAELESLAARVGVAVRAEPFRMQVLRGRGGLCWVHGLPLVVMDASLTMVDRIPLLAEALAQFPLDGLSMAPAVRDVIEAARGNHAATAGASAPAGRPGLARTRPR